MRRYIILALLILFFLVIVLFAGLPQQYSVPEAHAGIMNNNKKYENENVDGAAKKGLIRIANIRKYTGENYTRIAVDLDREVRFEQHRLKNPDRIYVDLHGTYLDPSLKNKTISIGDGILKKIRPGYFSPTTVRIVMDLERLESFKVFALKSPDRIVIDLYGKGEVSTRKDFNETVQEKVLPLTLPEQLGLKVKRVVIDPGHGGKDSGAIGGTGLTEKEIVLDVSKRLKKKLESNFGWDVILTRDSDVFIPLEERIAIANAKKADLFISIHANASRRREAKGVETYFLNLSSNSNAIEVAARENAVSLKNISDLQKILNELLLNSKINESSRLAGAVQKNLVETLNVTFTETKDLGVKPGPFYVLIGAKMPSILVEISFITNPHEETLLKSDAYREKINEGIFAGVKSYVKSLMSAL